MRIIGDIHGDLNAYKAILEDCTTESVQIGDFGIGFARDYWHDKLAEWQVLYWNALHG